MTTVDDVRERLAEVRPVGLDRDIVAAGLVRQVSFEEGVVRVSLLAGPLPRPVLEATIADIRRGVGALDGVGEVDVRVETATRPRVPEAEPLPGIGAMLAVSSTKGGVGKSTVAVDLACAFASLGRRVGLLDADVYGPSVPMMLGLSGRPKAADGSKVLPLEQHGLRVISMGFFLDDSSPVIWRGPLVTGLLRQFLRDVQWGELDLLLVDLPPGTGDALLTLVQQVPLAGAIVVTTPQDVSLRDVERGVAMFAQVNIPVLGIVENMSFYECPECGEREELFGSGGGGRLEASHGAPLIGQIPLMPEVRMGGDAGRPIVIDRPDHEVSRLYRTMAERLLADLASGDRQPPTPRIVG